MIIDTNKIRNQLNDFYAKEAEKADKIKNDKIAIRTLTKLETEQIDDDNLINAIEELAETMARLSDKE